MEDGREGGRVGGREGTRAKPVNQLVGSNINTSGYLLKRLWFRPKCIHRLNIIINYVGLIEIDIWELDTTGFKAYYDVVKASIFFFFQPG